MKSYDELTKDLLERRDRYEALQKQKKQKIKRIATPLCCFVLVGLLVLGVWQGGLHQAVTPVQPNGAVSQPTGSQQSSREENHPSVPSVVSKESQAENPSAVSQVTSHDKSSVASKPVIATNSSDTSKETLSDKQEQQDAVTMPNGATSQKPVPTFRIERPAPGYFYEINNSPPNAMRPDRPSVDADSIPYTPPSFSSVESFHDWLEKGGSREEERENLLSISKNSSTVTLTSYYCPQLTNGNKSWRLTNMIVNQTWLYYNYASTIDEGKTSFGIYIGVSEGQIKELDYEMQLCSELAKGPVENWDPAFNRYGSVTVKGVEYACYYFPKDKVTSVYWKTNGITFCAVYDGEYADVGKILPLLGMERVGYKVVK